MPSPWRDLLAGARHGRLEAKRNVSADTRAERRDAVGIAGRGDEHDLAGGGRGMSACALITSSTCSVLNTATTIGSGMSARYRCVAGATAELRQALAFARSTSKPITVNPAAIRRRA